MKVMTRTNGATPSARNPQCDLLITAAGKALNRMAEQAIQGEVKSLTVRIIKDKDRGPIAVAHLKIEALVCASCDMRELTGERHQPTTTD